jgi:hypothetical protein
VEPEELEPVVPEPLPLVSLWPELFLDLELLEPLLPPLPVVPLPLPVVLPLMPEPLLPEPEPVPPPEPPLVEPLLPMLELPPLLPDEEPEPDCAYENAAAPATRAATVQRRRELVCMTVLLGKGWS